MGGIQARAPVASTSPFRATIACPSTSTDDAPMTRARPRTKCPPLPTNRSTATWSSHESVASSRMRRATGAQSGVMTDVPALPGTRRPADNSPAPHPTLVDGAPSHNESLTAHGSELAPVGDVDGLHDGRADVDLDLVVAPEREVGRITFVDTHLLPGCREE